MSYQRWSNALMYWLIENGWHYVGPMNKISMGQHYLSTLGQRYSQQNANVVPTNDCYLDLHCTPLFPIPMIIFEANSCRMTIKCIIFIYSFIFLMNSNYIESITLFFSFILINNTIALFLNQTKICLVMCMHTQSLWY